MQSAAGWLPDLQWEQEQAQHVSVTVCLSDCFVAAQLVSNVLHARCGSLYSAGAAAQLLSQPRKR